MILDQIVAATRLRVDALKQTTDIQSLEKRLPDVLAPRPFAAALKHPNRLGLIAEIKRASPSKGIISHDFDPAKQAALYRDGGADCLSVLTEPQWFGGELEHLSAARAVAAEPTIRKDFIVDEIQITQARLAGAYERLRPLFPDTCTVVSESGVFTKSDARRLRDAGADALLVGESLMRAGNAKEAIAELLS